jgi:hypothetical protein
MAGIFVRVSAHISIQERWRERERERERERMARWGPIILFQEHAPNYIH